MSFVRQCFPHMNWYVTALRKSWVSRSRVLGSRTLDWWSWCRNPPQDLQERGFERKISVWPGCSNQHRMWTPWQTWLSIALISHWVTPFLRNSDYLRCQMRYLTWRCWTKSLSCPEFWHVSTSFICFLVNAWFYFILMRNDLLVFVLFNSAKVESNFMWSQPFQDGFFCKLLVFPSQRVLFELKWYILWVDYSREFV